MSKKRIKSQNGEYPRIVKIFFCCFAILVVIGLVFAYKDGISKNDDNIDTITETDDDSDNSKGTVIDSNNTTDKKQEENKTTNISEKSSSNTKNNKKYDIEVDAKTISNVYYNNELDGNKKYFGKIIKTTAKFVKAEKSSLSGWMVSFDTDGKYDYYCTSFKKGEKNYFSEYNRGETLVIYGKVDELIGNSLNLKNCDIEKLK